MPEFQKVGSNATDVMDLIDQAGKDKGFILWYSWIGFQKKAWLRLKMGLPTSNDVYWKWIFLFEINQKSFTDTLLKFWVLLNSRCSQVNNREYLPILPRYKPCNLQPWHACKIYWANSATNAMGVINHFLNEFNIYWMKWNPCLILLKWPRT